MVKLDRLVLLFPQVIQRNGGGVSLQTVVFLPTFVGTNLFGVNNEVTNLCIFLGLLSKIKRSFCSYQFMNLLLS